MRIKRCKVQERPASLYHRYFFPFSVENDNFETSLFERKLMNLFVRTIFISCLLIGAHFPLHAQFENAVTFEYAYSPNSNIAVGDEITLSITATIEPGFHMYSARQVEKMMMLAATFDLDDEAKGVKTSGALADKGHVETKYDDIFEGDISLYHDEVVYIQKLTVTGANPKIVGFLRYQVCDDAMCIPGSYDVDFAIKTVEKGAAPKAEVKAAEEEKPAPEIKKEVPQEVKSTSEETPQVSPSLSITDNFPQQGAVNNGEDDILNAVKWTQTISPKANIKAGDMITMTFEAAIDPGFHVYSSVPPEKPAGLPTTFDLDETSRGVELEGNITEEGEVIKKYDDIFETDVQIFEDKVVFTQKLKATEDNPVIEGYLSYQVCDESRCIPDKVEFAYNTANSTSGSENTTTGTKQDTEQDSIWILILKGLALGFGSVLTPCVFPLIPLTVSFFTKQSDTRARGIRNAALYGLSIISIYTILGLLVAIIFGEDAMRQLSVSPAFNLALFAFIFIFGLSFLGMFDITLPSSWSTALSKGSDRGGVLGIFLMAMTLAIVSFSCTGPLVFTALADAATGVSFFRPIVAMLSFSGALALPFVFFAVFPGYMNSLPNSGGWLNSVKVVLGLLEIALAFIYLSRADLVLHLGLLDREIFIGAWIVIFSMLGLYLLGKITLPHDSPVDRLSVPRFLMAMGSFWFVLYLVPGLWGAPLNMLGGYIPESNNEMGVLILDGQMVSAEGSGSVPMSASAADICSYPDKISEHLSEGTPKGFCAFYDLEQGLEYAKKVNKPVFLDFTGHTCANCRYLEKNAWVDPQVRNFITNEFVLISLYTDDRKKLPQVETTEDGRKLRTVGDKWIQYERDVYRQNAQPYYVLMDHDKSNLIPPTGYNPPLDVQEYRDFFARGLEEFRRRKGI